MECANKDLYGKLETDKEFKASAESFHRLLKHTPHHTANISADKLHGCDLLEGDWGTVGSIIQWTYTHDGKRKVAKEKIKAVDDEKNKITFEVLEGELMDHFSKFEITLTATPKENGGEGCVVHWLMEYEKHHGEIVEPHSLLELFTECSKEIDDHLVNLP